MVKKFRKSINRFYKFTKKNKFKTIVIVFLSFLLLSGIVYLIYYLPGISKNTKSVGESTVLKINPPYTEEMRKRDEATRRINEAQMAIDTAPYVFSKTDLVPLVEKYRTTISTLSSHFLEPVDCLVNSYNQEKPYVIDIDPKRISDQKVLAFANEITNHEFSDELVYYDRDGSTKIDYQGETSKHTVSFDSICKRNNIYFFAFNSFGKKTHIGGGGSPPSHFAFSDGLGNLTILEKQTVAHIKLPQDPESDLTFTTGIAYYGCRGIYAANDLEVLFECGGGDGPVGAGGLYLLDLNSKTSNEKVFCENSSVSKYLTQCFNEDGVAYFQELN